MKLVEVNDILYNSPLYFFWGPELEDLPFLEYLEDGAPLDVELFDYFYYFTYQPLYRYINNSQVQPQKVFERNMDRALEKYIISQREHYIQNMRNNIKKIDELIKQYPVTMRDKEHGILTYHVEHIWIAEKSKSTCEVCNKNDGKNILDIKKLNPHFNCRCEILTHYWWEDKKGQKFYEKEFTFR